jgi:hypothetical protein
MGWGGEIIKAGGGEISRRAATHFDKFHNPKKNKTHNPKKKTHYSPNPPKPHSPILTGLAFHPILTAGTTKKKRWQLTDWLQTNLR